MTLDLVSVLIIIMIIVPFSIGLRIILKREKEKAFKADAKVEEAIEESLKKRESMEWNTKVK